MASPDVQRGGTRSEEIERHKHDVIKKFFEYNKTEHVLDNKHPVVLLFDNSQLQHNIQQLLASFGPQFQHCFAIKANSSKSVNEKIIQFSEGKVGCETASPGELYLALKYGYKPHKIVFDSPAKTNNEILFCLKYGININIDNFQELAFYVSAFENYKFDEHYYDPTDDSNDIVVDLNELEGGVDLSMFKTGDKSWKIRRPYIGIRLNPQVGGGAILQMSTATKSSKFGIPLFDGDNYKVLESTYKSHSWLNSIHLHVGSQGCPLDLITDGISIILEFVDKVNKDGKRVTGFDIGGGLPVNFDTDAVSPTYLDYAAILKEKVPKLFEDGYKIFTEFGRSLAAKCGVILSKVEYTKVSGGKHIAIVQAGADLFVRTVYMPDKWAIRITAVDSEGNSKTGELVPQDIAGPCCFSGDVIAHLRPLPLLVPGDYIVAHDTGAYYISAFSFYNSRQIPNVVSCEHNYFDSKASEKHISFTVNRRTQTFEQTYRYLNE